MTNPPDSHRLWQTLDALAHAVAVTLYDDEAAAVIQHADGLWAAPYAEFDALAELGWVVLTEDGGEAAYEVTIRGLYWLGRHSGRMLAEETRQRTFGQPAFKLWAEVVAGGKHTRSQKTKIARRILGG